MKTFQPSDSPAPTAGADTTALGGLLVGPGPTRFVLLPRYAGGLDEHLGQVDVALTHALEDLSRVWTTELDDQGDLDVLGDRDLPVLIQQMLHGGGKRLRPAMSYLGWLSACGADWSRGEDDVVTVGAALELLHIFALIHDDVMDESASRRGHPSVHAQARRMHVESGASGNAQRFGESIAMLVGDLAHAEADQLAARLPPEMRKIWRVLVVELVCGQRRDLTGSVAGRRDLGHARQVARMKSGSYTVERPLQLGASAAQASPAVLASLSGYGREVGEAFALRDDLLGAWGDPALTGKPAGDDLLSGKPTVILAIAEERVAGRARFLLNRVGTPELTTDDVAVLQEDLEEVGVVKEVESMISGHLRTALSALDSDLLSPEGVLGLTQIAHQIAWRDR